MPPKPLRQVKTSPETGQHKANGAAGKPKRKSRKYGTIIAAAREVFFEDGYAGASMDRITARAGVSKATIYANFRSKEEVLRAVVQAMVEPIADQYETLTSRTAEFDEWLLALGKQVARNAVLPDVIALERLVLGEALRFPELGKLFYEHAIQAALRSFRPRFEAAIEAGYLRPCDPAMALARFAQWCTGSLRREVIMNLRPYPDQAEIDAFAADAVAAFLQGYGGQK